LVAKRVLVAQKDTEPKATELRVDDHIASSPLATVTAWLPLDMTAPIVACASSIRN
jgi:hypothetical protein